MEVLQIFHGSNRIVSQPEYGLGNPRNDYGLGFYCTQEIELAKEWACAEQKDGFVNEYGLTLDGLSVLRLNSPDYHILNWLAILLENRTFDLWAPVSVQAREYLLAHFLPDYSSFDLIIGYRADDSYFSFSRAFLSNTISLGQLRHAMQLGNLGEQVVLKSRRAFDRLLFRQSIPVDGNIYYPRRELRDREAREAYRKMQSGGSVAGAVFVSDILRGQWRNDDERL